MRKTIDAMTARRLSVEASCDPRTIMKVLRGEGTNHISAHRARLALIRAGFLLDNENARQAA